MAIRLFNLSGVPPEEASKIRQLLIVNRIRFYETPSGNWGPSLAAIWLPDKNQLHLARRLIEDYQQEHANAARIAYERKVRSSIVDRIKQNPARYILLLLVAIIVASAAVLRIIGVLHGVGLASGLVCLVHCRLVIF